MPEEKRKTDKTKHEHHMFASSIRTAQARADADRTTPVRSLPSPCARISSLTIGPGTDGDATHSIAYSSFFSRLS